MKLYEVSENKGVVCESILRSLPKWFGIEEAIQKYIVEVESLPCFAVASESGDTIGFLSLKATSPFAVEIHLIGVHPDYHRNGVGRALLRMAEYQTSGQGRKFLTVKTISPAKENEEYAATRAFYQAQGFVPLEEFPTLWGERNPCLMMIKVLGR